VGYSGIEKSFYSVIRDILLLKMKFYGIISTAHTLMESYLRNRYQSLTINALNDIKFYSSLWEKIQHEVPQG
jgi:hypothetical protein